MYRSLYWPVKVEERISFRKDQEPITLNTINEWNDSVFLTKKGNKIQRNSVCLCGSNKKYKKCCGK